MIRSISNRILKYPLGRWYIDSLVHQKWFYSTTTNQLYTRHDQVYKDYVVVNKDSRINEGNCVAKSRFCKTLLEDITKVDVYYDWSYKVQNYTHPLSQPITETTNIRSLYEAKYELPIEDHLEINKMQSMDQGTVVAKVIVAGNDTTISDRFFTQHRGTSACIIKANSDVQSKYTMYIIHQVIMQINPRIVQSQEVHQ